MEFSTSTSTLRGGALGTASEARKGQQSLGACKLELVTSPLGLPERRGRLKGDSPHPSPAFIQCNREVVLRDLIYVHGNRSIPQPILLQAPLSSGGKTHLAPDHNLSAKAISNEPEKFWSCLWDMRVERTGRGACAWLSGRAGGLVVRLLHKLRTGNKRCLGWNLGWFLQMLPLLLLIMIIIIINNTGQGSFICKKATLSLSKVFYALDMGKQDPHWGKLPAFFYTSYLGCWELGISFCYLLDKYSLKALCPPHRESSQRFPFPPGFILPEKYEDNSSLIVPVCAKSA